MSRWILSKLMAGAVMTAAVFAYDVSDAQATWWRWHGSHGSSGGSSGSYGSSGSSGSYGSHGSWGGWRLRRSFYSHGSHGSSGSHGSWGSSGGSSGHYSAHHWGSSGGSSGGSAGGVYYYDPSIVPGTVIPGTNTPMPGTSAPMGQPMSYAPASDATATLLVHVPAEAKVWVNGRETTSVGAQRRYVSTGLQPGYNYTYELKVEFELDGRVVSQSKTIKVQAGQTEEIRFDGSSSGSEPVATQSPKTKLTLTVPADAKVFLAGRETKSTGMHREFTTTLLGQGQTWNDYVVRIEVERDGQVLSHEEKITLVGGQTQELAFDLDDAVEVARVADR